jgi:hypothetical protein
MSQVAKLDEECIKEKLFGELTVKYKNGIRVCIKKTVSIEPEVNSGKEKEKLQVK